MLREKRQNNMVIHIKMSVDKRLLDELEYLNLNLSRLKSKIKVNECELAKALESFSQTIKAILNSGDVITGKVK